MTIFGQSRLGRAAYAILLLMMFGFDFLKPQIERLIMAEQDKAAHQLMASHPTHGQGNAASLPIQGKNTPLMFGGQEEALRQIAASGRKPTQSEIEMLRGMAVDGAIGMAVGDTETASLMARRSSFEMLYVVAAIAMTAITVIGLLYMVSSRLRDIGWPQYLMWVLLAPVFLPKFIAIPLPALATQGIALFFYGVLFVLALVSNEGSTPTAPSQAARPSALTRPRRGQFGRLGMDG